MLEYGIVTVMRYVLENIEVEKLSSEIQRRGVLPRQKVRVVVETLDDNLTSAQVAQHGGAFDFLADEPNIYRESDLKQSNV